MGYRVVNFALLSLVLPFLTPARAASVPECKARVLQPITDNLGNDWSAGKLLSVNIERDDKNGGAFCVSGGSCIPRKLNGKDAVRLVNCQIGPSIGAADRRLVPDPQLAGVATANAIRLRSSVEQSLSNLGFSNASAGGLADTYVTDPKSVDGRLVRRALSGSSTAVAVLKRDHP